MVKRHDTQDDPCEICGLTAFCHGDDLTDKQKAAKKNQETAQKRRKLWSHKQYLQEIAALSNVLPKSSPYLQTIFNEMNKKFPNV
jgi:hypothetical protein